MAAAAVEMSPTTRLGVSTAFSARSQDSGRSLLINAAARSAGVSRHGSVHSQPASPTTRNHSPWMSARQSPNGMATSRAASEILSPKQPQTSHSAPETSGSMRHGAAIDTGSNTRRSVAYTGGDKQHERASTGSSRMSISVGEMLSPSTSPYRERHDNSGVVSPAARSVFVPGGDGADAEKPTKWVL